MSYYPEYEFIAAVFDPVRFIQFKKVDNIKWRKINEKILRKQNRETYQKSILGKKGYRSQKKSELNFIEKTSVKEEAEPFLKSYENESF